MVLQAVPRGVSAEESAKQSRYESSGPDPELQCYYFLRSSYAKPP